ncbi:MAG: hypothetical protein HY286_12445 [Planctomycetes bacterium]|nr:hypothetical protein [Planctomycetota bacterium]
MDDRTLLRHALATLAYRGGKAIRDVPGSFATFDGAGKAPIQILSHISDLSDWALSMARGEQKWISATPLDWNAEAARFHKSLEAFDTFLASTSPIQAEITKLLQGPVADALTHVGQLAMLRRMAGCPARGENYFAADVTIGRVGADQPPPRAPFKA